MSVEEKSIFPKGEAFDWRVSAESLLIVMLCDLFSLSLLLLVLLIERGFILLSLSALTLYSVNPHNSRAPS